jgi:hypothetical protein
MAVPRIGGDITAAEQQLIEALRAVEHQYVGELYRLSIARVDGGPWEISERAERIFGSSVRHLGGSVVGVGATFDLAWHDMEGQQQDL